MASADPVSRGRPFWYESVVWGVSRPFRFIRTCCGMRMRHDAATEQALGMTAAYILQLKGRQRG